MTPPTLLPAAPPAAKISACAVIVSPLSSVTANELPFCFTPTAGVPARRVSRGWAVRAHRSTSSTELAMLERGYTRPSGSVTVSSPIPANHASVSSTGNVSSAYRQKFRSPP